MADLLQDLAMIWLATLLLLAVMAAGLLLIVLEIRPRPRCSLIVPDDRGWLSNLCEYLFNGNLMERRTTMKGWKTYAAAAATAVLGIVSIAQGDYETGVQTIVGALALVGLGHKLDKMTPVEGELLVSLEKQDDLTDLGTTD